MTEHVLALSVCRVAGRDYSVVTDYDEADPLGAVGQVLATLPGDNGATDCVLNTGHPLFALWCSAEGRLWVASSDAFVFTTALAAGPEADGAEYDDGGSGMAWRALRLPADPARGLPVPTAIGGNDRLLVVGTVFGDIYRLVDGAWVEDFRGAPVPAGGRDAGAINGFAAGPGGTLFAFGYRGTVMVRADEGWRRLALAGASRDMVTGMAALSDGSMAACTTAGTIHRLVPGGETTIIGRAPTRFYGMVAVDDRLVLAGDPVGAWELRAGGRPTALRDSFEALKVFRTGNLLRFALSEQPRGPGFATHDLDSGRWYLQTLI